MSSYHALAPYYDALTQNVDYQQRAAFILAQRERYQNTGTVLDAGCGTGTLALLLTKAGCELLCVDASADMLCQTDQKFAAAGKRALFVQQPLQRLHLPEPVATVVCMQDTVNHLGAQFAAVIARFAHSLVPGGLLIFDCNTAYKHEHILADNAFVFEHADGLVVWQNEYEAATGRVCLTVDVFSRQPDSRYTRETDQFYEYTIASPVLEQTLKDNGFVIVEQIDGESYGAVCDTTQRILYVAQKL